MDIFSTGVIYQFVSIEAIYLYVNIFLVCISNCIQYSWAALFICVTVYFKLIRNMIAPRESNQGDEGADSRNSKCMNTYMYMYY